MSKSVFIEYHGQGFWAFDVVASILLKHLVDVATPQAHTDPWLNPIVQRWRVATSIPDCYGFELDEQWTEEQVDIVIGLFDAVGRLLGMRDEISSEEIQGWEIQDGGHIFARGLPFVRTRPVINLGLAIVSLLRNALPPAPSATWWWYGTEDSPQTIKMNR